jgi:N-acetylneuraminic acid mutarotase
VSNQWTAKANYGGGGRAEATGFSMNGKGYIGTGWTGTGSSPTMTNDFWEYDPITNQWTQKANFPGVGRASAVSFAANGKAYLGLGTDVQGTFLSDWWEYDPQTNQWTQKNDFPIAQIRSETFVIDGVGYVGGGWDIVTTHNKLWCYDAQSDSWTQMADIGTLPRQLGVGFAIESNGYIGTGAIWARHTTMISGDTRRRNYR